MKIPVAILGATGVVGQKAIALLSQKTKFEIIELVASDAKIGKIFKDVCDWREPLTPLPDAVSKIKLSDPKQLKAKYIISCLPTDIANILEPALAKQGKFIFSNASSFRMEKNVPLLIPEINTDHLNLIKNQITEGKIITNPNCSAVGVCLAIAPLMNLEAIEHISIVTMQSLSGAGYPGVSSLDILSNTIPHIPDEANKLTEETKKILGEIVKPADFDITTHVHRVPVFYGHSITLHIMFKDNVKIDDVKLAYKEWNMNKSNIFVLHDKLGRPQSIRDLTHDDMRVHIGHIFQGDKKNMIGLVSLTHNLVRGAAGAAITNMETFIAHCGVNNEL